MKPRKMTSKKAGTCTHCGEPIVPGSQIYWQRGAGAWHTDCETAAMVDAMCSACGGSGARWNNAPCTQCDGTGARTVQRFAQQGGHPKK